MKNKKLGGERVIPLTPYQVQILAGAALESVANRAMPFRYESLLKGDWPKMREHIMDKVHEIDFLFDFKVEDR